MVVMGLTSLGRRGRAATQQVRDAAGMPCATASARTGPPGLARSAATPCTRAPRAPASSAGRPAASRVPRSPASTSPAPAVASHGGASACDHRWRRSPGGTTRVVAPLSSTVAPVELGEGAGVGQRSGLDLLPGHLGVAEPGEEAGALAGVRGEEGDGIRRASSTSASSRSRPPASTTTGSAPASASRATSSWALAPAARDADVEPGPTTQACTRPAPCTASGTAARTSAGRGRRADVAHHAGSRPRRRR